MQRPILFFFCVVPTAVNSPYYRVSISVVAEISLCNPPHFYREQFLYATSKFLFKSILCPIYAVFSPQNAGFRPIWSRIHNIEGVLTTYILAIEKNTPPLQSKTVVY